MGLATVLDFGPPHTVGGPGPKSNETRLSLQDTRGTSAPKAVDMTIPQAQTERRHDAYESLLRRCREIEPISTAVAYPCEETALAGAIEAAEEKLIAPIFVGPRELIREIARKAKLNIDAYPIEDAPD